ncbi:MAG: hypothetical protein GC168_12370 [Candidatus Hydrogenedens sp.]|nr:hypothetical protein [Candidatus Hydrogenedens sp.]
MPTGYEHLSKCARCGKLYHREPGRTLCHACSGQATPEPPQPVYTEEHGIITEAQHRFQSLMRLYEQHTDHEPHAAELPRAEGRRLLHGSQPVEQRPHPGACTLCGQPTLKNSDFCFDCHSHLHRSLGDAAGELFTRLEAVESAPGRISSVLSALESARARTATSRINPVAQGKLRT